MLTIIFRAIWMWRNFRSMLSSIWLCGCDKGIDRFQVTYRRFCELQYEYKTRNEPFKDEEQAALFKDPVRTAL